MRRLPTSDNKSRSRAARRSRAAAVSMSVDRWVAARLRLHLCGRLLICTRVVVVDRRVIDGNRTQRRVNDDDDGGGGDGGGRDDAIVASFLLRARLTSKPIVGEVAACF